MTIGKKQFTRLRSVAFIGLALLVLYMFLLHPDQNSGSSRLATVELDDIPSSSAKKLPPELLNNRLMTSQQCADTFPGLTKEIDDAVAKGPFTLTKTSELGPLLARINDGKVGYLVSESLQNGYVVIPIEHG